MATSREQDEYNLASPTQRRAKQQQQQGRPRGRLNPHESVHSQRSAVTQSLRAVNRFLKSCRRSLTSTDSLPTRLNNSNHNSSRHKRRRDACRARNLMAMLSSFANSNNSNRTMRQQAGKTIRRGGGSSRGRSRSSRCSRLLRSRRNLRQSRTETFLRTKSRVNLHRLLLPAEDSCRIRTMISSRKARLCRSKRNRSWNSINRHSSQQRARRLRI